MKKCLFIVRRSLKSTQYYLFRFADMATITNNMATVVKSDTARTIPIYNFHEEILTWAIIIWAVVRCSSLCTMRIMQMNCYYTDWWARSIYFLYVEMLSDSEGIWRNPNDTLCDFNILLCNLDDFCVILLMNSLISRISFG